MGPDEEWLDSMLDLGDAEMSDPIFPDTDEEE